MYRSRTSSRVFPGAASRAAWYARLRASLRSRDSRCCLSRYSSAPGHGSPGSSFHARCCSAPGHVHRCCQTVRETSFRSARGHAAWQGQRHRTLVDSSRRGDACLRTARPTCPQSRCASLAHARERPAGSKPGPASDTTKPCLPRRVPRLRSRCSRVPRSGRAGQLANQPLKAFAAAAQATDHHGVRAGHACLDNQEVKPPPHGIPAVHDLDLVSP